MEEGILDELAQAGYETMFEERWGSLHPQSIERAMWLSITQNILKRLRELYNKSAKVPI